MMTTTLKKFSALMLALGMIFILSFPSLAHAADTGGSDHFELTAVENKDSKSGAEIADLTIKNISGKTGTNVTFEADLPTIFHDKDLKKVTVCAAAAPASRCAAAPSTRPSTRWR